MTDFRQVEIELFRSDYDCRAEVLFGNSRVVAVVRAEIVSPYPDRPTEGMLQFNVQTSLETNPQLSSQTICRSLERFIRDSDAIDSESLCIISGEKVWMIVLDVTVLDSDGCECDCCLLAAISALRGFRKPEISVKFGDVADSKSEVIIHSPDDREPLPLALHHTPLLVTFGVMMRRKDSDQRSGMQLPILLCDPTAMEEPFVDGSITVCVNAHK